VVAPPEVEVMPVGPLTAPFCVRVPLAFMLTEPVLDVTLPLRTMLPPALLAASEMLPLADAPLAPMVRGLLLVRDSVPPLAATWPEVLSPPVFTTTTLPEAVTAFCRSSTTPLTTSMSPLAVLLACSAANWLPASFRAMPFCAWAVTRPPVVWMAPFCVMWPDSADRLTADAVMPPATRLPAACVTDTLPPRLMLPPVRAKLSLTTSEPAPLKVPPVWL
jgi:hypothetical protein